MTYKSEIIQGPFKGIWDATPKPNTPKESFDELVNLFCRKGRLQSRPKLTTFTAPADGKIIRNMITFADSDGDYHTLVLTSRTPYYLTSGPTYTPIIVPAGATPTAGTHDGGDNQSILTDSGESWTANEFVGLYVHNTTDGSKGLITANTTNTITATLAGGTGNDWDDGDEYEIGTLAGTSQPFAMAPMNGRVYFSNGSGVVLYCDGTDTLGIAGDCPGACRFMTVNAFHLIIGYTTEPAPGEAGSTVYPIRIRWSKSGDPDDWTSFTSGFNDLVEVPDQITGLTTLGRNTFIARTNGFTMMSPTGNGQAPFIFEQYNYAPKGVGNRFPYSLATYGNTAVFVSADDIYMLDGAALTPIGGNCKKKIFEQIAQASGDVVRGDIIPRMGVSYDFLSYWLSIPGVNYTWVYSKDDQAWSKFYSSAGRLTCIANVSTG
jgi:hypothetical protein